MHHPDTSQSLTVDKLSRLVYELLDAHVDTICMGDELVGGMEWEAHLDYLRGLQRVSREVLASAQPVEMV